jgi:hypothetical protein
MTSDSSGGRRVVDVVVLPGTVVVLVDVEGGSVTEVEVVELDGLVVTVMVVVTGVVVVVEPGSDVVVVVPKSVVEVVEGTLVVVVDGTDVEVVVGGAIVATNLNLNFFALSVPSMREHSSRILALSFTLPVSGSQASHLALSLVMPLRLAAYFVGGMAGQRSSRDAGEPATTAPNGDSGVVTT